MDLIKRRFILFILLILLFSPGAASLLEGAEYIADYKTAKESVLRTIPTSAIEAAKNKLHILYCGTSHSTQTMDGMRGLMEYKSGDNALFAFSYNGNPVAGKLDIHYNGTTGTDLSNDSLDSNGHTPYFRGTVSYLDSHPDVNVVMWSWCSIEGHDVQRYLDNFQELIDMYKAGGTKGRTAANKVDFVFMTGYARGSNGDTPEPPYIESPYQNHKRIVDYCRANGYFCLDYWSQDVRHYETDAYKPTESGNDNVQHKAYFDTHQEGVHWFATRSYSSGSVKWPAHCNATPQHITSNRRAYAAWWIWARLAGWDGQTSAQPTLTVTAPNGGETWTAGSSQNITWNTTGTVGNVIIECSTDNGGSWSVVTASTPNDGSYQWTVPNEASNQCRIRISETDGSPTDTGNGTFTITAAATPTITVTAPNGGETWTAGTTETITWTSTGSVGNIKIEYSSNNGASWTTITASTANDGSHTWTVPTINCSQCLVRVSEAGGGVTDTGNGTFTITTPTTPTITVTAPNGGESWTVGSTQTIAWSSTGTIGNVKIEYSVNNGAAWTTIVSSMPNDCCYAWKVPNTVSTQCRVRVSELDGSPTDTCNAAFSIAAPTGGTVTITSPNGGETLTAGSTHTITWTSTGTLSDLKLKYSTDNGANWTIIAYPAANTGSYSWTVPNTNSTQCLIKLYELNGSADDNSDAVFTISGAVATSLTLTSPNGGETLTAGSTHSITWTSTGTLSDLKLKYSADNGANWVIIAYPVPNTGSYSWTVPNINSTQCLVKIYELNGTLADNSNGVFTISGASPTSLTLTSPNGGEVLQAGATHRITWTGEGNLGELKLKYSTNNGSSWNVIAYPLSNTGYYDWTVPAVSSAKCLVKIYDLNNSSLMDVSDAVFTIVDGNTPTLTLTSPNGGEILEPDTTHRITWTSTGTVDKVIIKYSTDNGGSWKYVSYGTSNDGLYGWTVPKVNSAFCLIKITDSDGSPSDVSNAPFTIGGTVPASLTLTSPNGGENLVPGTTHVITWTSQGNIDAVNLEYTVNNGDTWNTITASTTNDGSYGWRVPDAPSARCLVRVSQSGDDVNDVSDSLFTIVNTSAPEIYVDKTRLNFGYTIDGPDPDGQVINVENVGGGTLYWGASAQERWIGLSPMSGMNNGSVTVSIEPRDLAPGVYEDIIRIMAEGSDTPPRFVTVRLTVLAAQEDAPPFGSFDSPLDGARVCGSIAVTGWVIDDCDVESVKIYREEGNSLVYIGDGIFVEGARPDVEEKFPDAPKNYRAGWGYMLLTNFLPNQGNGTYRLHAVAVDSAGKKVTLGVRTIYCDNANSVKPFGAIDSPEQGGVASGRSYRNFGWVLTPMPNHIPQNGSLINVYVNGALLGNPTYNLYRKDIAGLFPGYANSEGALGYFDIDTTAYENGVHNIYWVAWDSAGNVDGIGSRYFSVRNDSGGSERAAANRVQTKTPGFRVSERVIADLPTHAGSIEICKGFDLQGEALTIEPDERGVVTVESTQLQRIEIRLNNSLDSRVRSDLPGTRLFPLRPRTASRYAGYMMVGQQLRSLPIGSTLDAEEGVFYWLPGHGFIGQYRLIFVEKQTDGSLKLRTVVINIKP